MSTADFLPRSDSSSREHRSGSFHVGYYHLHPDVSLNYQMNRFSSGEADMIAEMRAVAPRIHDYADYTREFLALSQQAQLVARSSREHTICAPPSSTCSPTTPGNSLPDSSLCTSWWNTLASTMLTITAFPIRQAPIWLSILPRGFDRKCQTSPGC